MFPAHEKPFSKPSSLKKKEGKICHLVANLNNWPRIPQSMHLTLSAICIKRTVFGSLLRKSVYLCLSLFILPFTLESKRFLHHLAHVDATKTMFNRRGRHREMHSYIISRYLQLTKIGFFSLPLHSAFL